MTKSEKKPIGRPVTEMTPENIEKILRTVELGIWPDRAAQMHGVSEDAMRKHKQRHPEFVTLLEKAEAKAESGIHGKILRHMDKQWTAAAWMLERRWPERYGKREPENRDDKRTAAAQLLADLAEIRKNTQPDNDAD